MFQGLGATLLGALVTVAGIWVTLRHDRQLATRASFEADCRACIRSTDEIRVLLLTVTSSGGSTLDIVQMMPIATWRTQVWTLKMQVETSEPCLAALIAAVMDRTKIVPKQDQIAVYRRDLGNLIRVLQARVADPNFSRMSVARCDELVAAIRRGEAVLQPSPT